MRKYTQVCAGSYLTCLMMVALLLGPSPSPSTMPAARATMFFRVPHISAPATSGSKFTLKYFVSKSFFKICERRQSHVTVTHTAGKWSGPASQGVGTLNPAGSRLLQT